MKKLIGFALSCALAAPVLAANVGVSVNVGEPGFYGEINIGDAPPPQLIYAQPVIVQQALRYDSAPPIYLHVPAGYEQHWHEHCAQYGACGRPVYFVRDDWYNKVYVPHYKHAHGEHGEHGHDHDHDHDRGL